MPYLRTRSPWFTFMAHPRGIDDLDREGALHFLRRYSRNESEFQAKACSLPPLVVGDVNFTSSRVQGEVICVMHLPDQMTTPQAGRSVLQGIEVALQRGSKVIGLGALTAPATNGGLTLLRHLPSGVTLTNGNAYTAAVVRQNVMEVASIKRLGEHARVAVIGCTGSVGVAASHLLAEVGFELILIGRSHKSVQERLGTLAQRYTSADTLNEARFADIVVMLTNDRSAKITPDQVARGAVIIDCAQPPNIPASDYLLFQRAEVTVVEGGIVHIPEFACTYDFGLANSEEAFACLAETYLFARSGIREHSVGYPTPALASRLDQLAEKYGISPRSVGLQVRPTELALAVEVPLQG